MKNPTGLVIEYLDHSSALPYYSILSITGNCLCAQLNLVPKMKLRTQFAFWQRMSLLQRNMKATMRANLLPICEQANDDLLVWRNRGSNSFSPQKFYQRLTTPIGLKDTRFD